MIVDIFHGQQFTLTEVEFTDQLQRRTIVNIRPVMADRLEVHAEDTFGNAHLYVIPCHTPAHDAVKAKLAR